MGYGSMIRFSGDAIENRDIAKFVLWALFWTGLVVWGLTLQGCANSYAQEKHKIKSTGITLSDCKSVTVYILVERGHIAAPIWIDKNMEIPGANPTVCNTKKQATFYVLPSQDYEIQVLAASQK
jgi:hypothetical protein